MVSSAAVLGVVFGWVVGENVFDALGLSDFLGRAPVERHIAAALLFGVLFHVVASR